MKFHHKWYQLEVHLLISLSKGYYYKSDNPVYKVNMVLRKVSKVLLDKRNYVCIIFYLIKFLFLRKNKKKWKKEMKQIT